MLDVHVHQVFQGRMREELTAGDDSGRMHWSNGNLFERKRLVEGLLECPCFHSHRETR